MSRQDARCNLAETYPYKKRAPNFGVFGASVCRFFVALLDGPAEAGHYKRIFAFFAVKGRYGSAYANTALPALIEMYCFPFTA
jgi:hypothetical protein